MSKSTLLGSVLMVMLFSAPAMSADFYALSGVQGAVPTSLQDDELSATEGGAMCSATGAAQAGGLADNVGVALCSRTNFAGIFGGSGLAITFSVFNAAPVSSANFLQVTGG